MKTTRRELAAGAVVAALAAQAEAQAPADSDIVKQVRDANRRNSEALAKYEIPIAAEPAFRFEA